jgi:hypothetical protein
MNVENFSKWLHRQGHTIYRTESSYWYDAGPRTLQAFPFYWLIQPSEAELRKLMLSKGILSLRYSAPITAPVGKASYHIELLSPYTLEMLKPHARNGVKKGQATFHVEQIPFARLADEGWLLQRDTIERQDRLSSMKQETWQRICLAAEGLSGFEAWGAIADGELAGALFTARVDDVFCVPYALSRTKYMREHVNNVLFFDTCCNLLSRPDVRKIFFTVQSLDAPESVDEFKFRMSFTPKPVRQRVVLHPLLTPLATSPGYNMFKQLGIRYPSSNVVAKTEGMVRFYRLGQLPLSKQEWPGCVEQYKNQVVLNPKKEHETKTTLAGRLGFVGQGGTTHIDGCQIPGYQRMAEGEVEEGSPSAVRQLKRALARPWNYVVKPQLKRFVRQLYAWNTHHQPQFNSVPVTGAPIQEAHLQIKDLVRVRSREEIESTLDTFKELKGCAFLESMWQYCGTTQRVLQPVERFLDERDYKVKKARGVVLLEGLLCFGTPVFGRCDRGCHLFWREEWLEKINEPPV